MFWNILGRRHLTERHSPPPPADFFRGRPEDWPAHLRATIRRHGVTDLVMLGDGRPVHAAAVDVAMANDVRIHVLEHGYIRPDWLTLEPDGMSGHSRMPRDPAVIVERARGLPAVAFTPLWRSSFLVYALYDFAYHLPNVFLGPFLHPHYRTHGPVHPLVEYGGWVLKWIGTPFTRRHRDRVLPRYLDGDRPYFLFPLQLPGDYQIRRHAPFGDLFAIVRATLRSFAADAPPECRLLFKVHPLDNGLSFWARRIARWAREAAISDRIDLVDGGPLDSLIRRARGVVSVNSTVGLTALALNVPLVPLGNSVYDVEGMTHHGTLRSFWSNPTRPDPDLVDAFLRLLVDRIQLRGGFVGTDAIEAGARTATERILETDERLPLSLRRERLQSFRYENELKRLLE